MTSVIRRDVTGAAGPREACQVSGVKQLTPCEEFHIISGRPPRPRAGLAVGFGVRACVRAIQCALNGERQADVDRTSLR